MISEKIIAITKYPSILFIRFEKTAIKTCFKALAGNSFLFLSQSEVFPQLQLLNCQFLSISKWIFIAVLL